VTVDPKLHSHMGESRRDWWDQVRGEGPVVACAIHNGHHCRPEVEAAFAIPQKERLREEDPFTEYFIRDVSNRVVVHRSRFEVDINRSAGQAVYLKPEQCWGLNVWREPPSSLLVETSLAMHRQFYAMLATMLSGVEATYGRFVVLDIHSYNHRRDGAAGLPTDPSLAPEVNIGTFSMPRRRWQHVLEPVMQAMRDFDYRGRRLDVRENVSFQGKGELARFVHEAFPETGCAIAIEFKKFFMDEWTGEPFREDLEALRALVRSLPPVIEASLREPG